MPRKKFKLNYDGRGGVVVMSQHMLKHEAYLILSPYAKVLMQLMQQHWRDEKEVDYGIREASEKIPCSKVTAIKTFKELEEREFIQNTSPAMFSSRTNSKSRSWRLEWMPFIGRKPTHNWEKHANEN